MIVANEPAPYVYEMESKSLEEVIYSALPMEGDSAENDLMENVIRSSIDISDMSGSERSKVGTSVNGGAFSEDSADDSDTFERKQLPLSEYAPQVLQSVTKDGGNDAVRGPIPFPGAPEEAFKWIDTIDGGERVSFSDITGNTGVSSNIKEILSMASVVQEQNETVENGFTDENGNNEADSTLESIAKDTLRFGIVVIDGVSQLCKNFISEDIPTLSDFIKNNASKKRASIYMMYAKPLFDYSHQVDFGLEMAIYSTSGSDEESGLTESHDICPEGPWGCMTYNGFYLSNMAEPTTAYYSGIPSMGVTSAAKLKEQTSCIPESVLNLRQLGNAVNDWKECWKVELVHSGSADGLDYDSDGDGAFYFAPEHDTQKVEAIDESSVYVTFIENYPDDGEGEDDDDDDSHDYWIYRLHHECAGKHLGHYCGGHVKLISNGLIYGFTKDEKAGKENSYKDKVPKDTSGKSLKDQEDKIDIASDISDVKINDKEKWEKAQDIFDIDMALSHDERAVSKDFRKIGWRADNISWASMIAMDDWKRLYDIEENDLNKAIGEAYGSGDDAPERVDDEKRKELVQLVRDILGNDPNVDVRADVINAALYYTNGQITYSQVPGHGSVLGNNARNDCSGFTSDLWYGRFGGVIFCTQSYKDTFQNTPAWHDHIDDQIKPGDILLHYDAGGNHALIYLGVVDGKIMSVDCSSHGTVSGPMYRHRSDSYYEQCQYISIDAIR